LSERIYNELTPSQLETFDYYELGPYLLACDVANTVKADELERLAAIVETRILVPDYPALSRAVSEGELDLTIRSFEAFIGGLRQ